MYPFLTDRFKEKYGVECVSALHHNKRKKNYHIHLIFSERERNALEMERDSLKGLAKLTKKGELQSRIDRKNEEINILKIGLSGTAKRYGFHTVHDFYKVYTSAKNAYADCQKKADKWKETYGTKSKGDTIHDRIQSYQREESARQSEQIAQRKDRGAR